MMMEVRSTLDQVQVDHVIQFTADRLFMNRQETYRCIGRTKTEVHLQIVTLLRGVWIRRTDLMDGHVMVMNPDIPFEVIIIDDLGWSIPC